MSPNPIRIGLIGLSAKGSWASGAHLPYLRDTAKYRIVALCNSSVDAARAAIAHHKLPDSTKAYGSAADLAANPDIDLVVCGVHVGKHFAVLKPVLEAGKDAFSEWPLGASLAEAEQLAALAKAKGAKTMVGLQGRQAPVVRKVKELVRSGRIGEVLSVTVTGSGYNFGAEDLVDLKGLSDIATGANMLAIHFSHYFDTVTQIVGQLQSFTSVIATKRPTTLLRDAPLSSKSRAIVGSVPRTSHDQVLLQGHLQSGALITYHMRGGLEFPGTPGSVFSIYGSTGEIRITTPSMSLSIGGPEVKVHDHKTGEVETVSTEGDDEWEKLPVPARNVARLYEAFAEHKVNEYADWDEAVVRHRLVDELYKRNEAGGEERPAQYTSGTYGGSLEL